jgi:hypothetical protein
MKTLLFFLMMIIAVATNAQYSEGIGGGSIRAGVGYVHDFPGVAGTAIQAEYIFPLNDWLQGGIGAKHIYTSGYPRTNTVKEYTKANTIDFELLFVPLHTENASLRIGPGYTFSFYNIRRSYPVFTAHDGQSTTVSYPSVDSKGRVRGVRIIGEYERYFNDSFSAGVRIEIAKAYGYVAIGGPFVSFKL